MTPKTWFGVLSLEYSFRPVIMSRFQILDSRFRVLATLDRMKE